MNTKTYATKVKDIVVGWKLVNAQEKVLGRLATDIVKTLQGKDKPYYTPTMVCGDKIVVINAEKIKVTGKKESDKVYVRHSGYIGGLKQETYGSLQKRRPGEVLRKAVFGMLPNNKLRKQLIANLYIYPGETHPHKGQIPS